MFNLMPFSLHETSPLRDVSSSFILLPSVSIIDFGVSHFVFLIILPQIFKKHKQNQNEKNKQNKCTVEPGVSCRVCRHGAALCP